MASSTLGIHQPSDFGRLDLQSVHGWSLDVWTEARNKMFWKRFMGKGANAVAQRITEMEDTPTGAQCIFYLVSELQGGGVVGDGQRRGNEEAMTDTMQIITMDQLSHQVTDKGKMANRKSALKVRKFARDKLSYWLANMVDQIHFLAAAGIDLSYNPTGDLRAADRNAIKDLAFNADITAPSSKRSLMWDGSALQTSSTGSITSSFLPSYKMLLRLQAYAQTHYIKPLMADGKEYYVLLMHPQSFALLKEDADYQRAVTTAYPRSPENPWFTGAAVTVDGLVIHPHRHVFNTTLAASGSKWGSGGTINGSRTMLCGAQSLATADMAESGNWVEEVYDYGNRWGISVDKIFGVKKPQFYNTYDRSNQDFGILCCDHYLPG